MFFSQSVILVLLSGALNAAAQLFVKAAVTGLVFNRWQDYLVHAVSNLWLISAILFYILSFAVWVVALSKMDIGVAMSVFTFSYVLVVLGGVVFFKEPLNMARLLGMLLIVAGIYTVSRNG